MTYSKIFPLLALSLIALPFAAHADVTDIRNSDSVIDFAAGANQLRYGESSSNATLDTEKGWQPDFNIGAGYLTSNTRNPWLDDIYFRGDINAAFGDTYYNGGLQEFDSFGHLVAIVPAKSTTHDQIYNFAGKIGRSFPLGTYVMATPFVDIGYHYWHRELTGIGGYTEEYGNGTAMGGAMVQFSPLPQWVFSLSGEAGSTFSPAMNTGGDTYHLQAQTIYEASARIGYEFTPRFEVFGTGTFTGFDYGASPILADGSQEPNSATHNFNALLGIAYHFQEAKAAPAHVQPSYTNNNGAYDGAANNSGYQSTYAPSATHQGASSASAKGF